MNLASELDRIAETFGANDPESQRISLHSVADRIAKNMGVKQDEVAILALSTRWRHLHFLVPEALKNVGYIPLTSKSALAARTARESRPEIINDFASVKHASVFEGVKVADGRPEAIQKIISAPILSTNRVLGVIQVSRKGTNAMTAGPDFTPTDLGKVLALCRPLGKLLLHFAVD